MLVMVGIRIMIVCEFIVVVVPVLMIILSIFGITSKITASTSTSASEETEAAAMFPFVIAAVSNATQKYDTSTHSTYNDDCCYDPTIFGFAFTIFGKMDVFITFQTVILSFTLVAVLVTTSFALTVFVGEILLFAQSAGFGV